MARSRPPFPFRFSSLHRAYDSTEVFTSRDPAVARGTKSVAQRRGKSSTTSQLDSSVSLLLGLRRPGKCEPWIMLLGAKEEDGETVLPYSVVECSCVCVALGESIRDLRPRARSLLCGLCRFDGDCCTCQLDGLWRSNGRAPCACWLR